MLTKSPLAKSALACVAMLLSTTALAQTPTDQLAKPPANARHFVIQSTGGKHGDSYSWVTADGTRMGRESMNLRGQVWEVDYSGTAGTDGMPVKMTIRGVTPTGDAAESFEIANGTAQWKSQVDSGSATYTAPAFYASMGGPFDASAWFLEKLLASPGRTMKLLPGGEARAEKLITLDVGEGTSKQKVTLWSMTGISTSPVTLWADANDKFFAATFGIAWLPAEYASEQKRMEAAQADALAALAPANIKALLKTPSGPVAFTNVKLYDADNVRFVAGQTVVVDKGLITAVGPAGTIAVPAGARVFDGNGKTLVPGLWDVHMHVNNDFTGLQELSMGVTSVRDPGNDDVQTEDRRKRASAGQLLFPNVYASSLIDGKGTYTAQVANAVGSEAEAIEAVRAAKTKGMVGVKFYGTLNKDWLPAAIAEAKRLGLHVHGHIPVGMRPLDAIKAGYDEVTHVNWVIMQAMPDSVIGVSNGIARFEGPGRYAKDVDLDGPEMTAMIDAMAKGKIYSDPTMIAFESLYYPENGELSPSYAPFVGTMPPTTERGFRTGGFAVPKGLTRADYRASWAKMVAMIGKMHKAGVPIIAGTDGSGIELIHELEIYGEAGMTPAEALATATIAPARMLKVDGRTGSIKVGKVADMVLVEGDPEIRIGDLRQTRTVMLGGKLLDADALRTAAGFSGRPK
jgi:cytosine/adenosine deaminase-related metal-dependent hydrolase